MNWLDFHCHLDMAEFNDTWQQVLDECFEAGFSWIVTVADPYEEGSMERTREILAYHDRVLAMMAAHPHKADHYSPEVEKRVLALLEHKKTVGLGETGLDFYYNFSTPENQQKVFRRQIAIASEMDLPLTIHSREAEAVVLRILEEEKFDRPVVFHCYTGNMADAQEILKRGYSISISGIVTFKKSDYLRDIVRLIPLEQIFTETDAPYLSPEPYRGKVNTPRRVEMVAERVAGIKTVDVSQLNDAVNQNFQRLFLLQR
jgi:TatD DNase family protein